METLGHEGAGPRLSTATGGSLWIIVPCFNEEAVLAETHRHLSAILGALVRGGRVAAESGICYVDDGSRDKTWEIVKGFCALGTDVAGIRLSRNRGHQYALLAGLTSVDADAVITIDADLQDDVNVIAQMVAEWLDGADIVYGVRADRSSDTAFKRWTASAFYRMMEVLGVELVPNHADFRLMSRRAIRELVRYRETNLFLRGLVPLLGFNSAVVSYDRRQRFAGETKYPLPRMLAFAAEGITSLSILPLRLITAVGLIIFLLSALISLIFLAGYLFGADYVPGWTSLLLGVFLLGGFQIMALGVIGEYVAKTYLEAKRRPRFALAEQINVPCGHKVR